MQFFAQLHSILLTLAVTATCTTAKQFFTIVASSPSTPLDGLTAYINNSGNLQYDPVLNFALHPPNPTNFTLDPGAHLIAAAANLPFNTTLEAATENSSYDETVFFVGDPGDNGMNPPTCHVYQNYLSCAVTSEGNTRLSQLYVCGEGQGFDTIGGALKIGNKAQKPPECISVQLNITVCHGLC